MTGRALLALTLSISQFANAHPSHEPKGYSKADRVSETVAMPWIGNIDIGKILEAIRRRAKTRTDLFDRSFSQTEINSCIESVCGTAASNISAFDVMSTRKTESETFKQTWAGVGQRVAESVRLEAAQEKSYRERMTATLARGLKLTDEEKIMPGVLLAFHLVLTRMQPVMMNLLTFNRNDFTVGLNEDAFAKVAGKLPDHEQRVMRKTMLQLMAPSLMDSVIQRGLGIDPVTLRLKRLYNGREANAALKEDATTALETYRTGTRYFGTVIMHSLLRPGQLQLLSRIAGGETLGVTDATVYAQAVSGLDMVAFMIHPSQLNDLKAFNIDPVAVFEKRREELKTEIVKRPSLAHDAEGTAMLKCRSQLNLSLARNASEFRLNRTRAMIADVRSAAKIVMGNIVSAKALPVAEKLIDAVAVEIPQPHDVRLAQFEGKIAEISEEANQQIEIMNDQSAASDAGLILDLMTDEPVASDVLVTKSGAQKTCEGLPVQSATDAAIPPLGRVHLSWYAANFPTIGTGIFAHELGHVLSYISRELPITENANYYRSLTCTVNRHPYTMELQAMSAVKSKTQTSEEDWADYLSSLIIKELIKRGNGPAQFVGNMACALVNDAGDTYKQNTTATTVNDTHSSGFMRLLLISSDLGRVTEQCKPFLAYANANGRALNCEAPGAK